MTPEITRAGIIPYTLIRGEVWLLLTEDLRTGEKGDFGGGKKEFETIYEAACREAKEESSGILNLDPSQEKLQPKLPIRYGKAVIYFIPVTSLYLKESKRFFDQKGGNKEVKTLHLVRLDEIWEDHKNYLKMWTRIKVILTKNRDSLSYSKLSKVFYE